MKLPWNGQEYCQQAARPDGDVENDFIAAIKLRADWQKENKNYYNCLFKKHLYFKALPMLLLLSGLASLSIISDGH